MKPRAIPEVKWPFNQRILVLSPHPDDFDAVAVTMRFFHQRGDLIYVAVLSGSAGGVLDSFCPAVNKVAVREQEQRASIRFFGLPEQSLTFLRLPEDAEGHLIENPDAVRREIEVFQPTLVVLPHYNDTNAGHRRAYAMFRKVSAVPALLFQDPKTTEFRCDLYMPFDDATADWKRKLLLHHRSQDHRNRTLRGHGFDDRILNVNRSAAAKIGCHAPYAEAFQCDQTRTNFTP
ncbi:MAG: PIG-L family deacetylase [Verrucomicrobiae bacterium]|nr:PIG-L family deacetylase [Verrucomicrobiae bacterium]